MNEVQRMTITQQVYNSWRRRRPETASAKGGPAKIAGKGQITRVLLNPINLHPVRKACVGDDSGAEPERTCRNKQEDGKETALMPSRYALKCNSK